MRDATAADWVPADPRDPAQLLAKQQAWSQRLAPLLGSRAVRLLLPAGSGRLPLLLAAAQALRAQDPAITLFLGYDPKAAPLWDESAWGAVHGGMLLPEDLGTDPERWREVLVQAQAQFPGRPWTLWLATDPGPRLSQLLGDGALLVLPAGGPGAALAQALPPGFTGVEGGLGDLTLRRPGTLEARRWRFEGGRWLPAELPKERSEVAVTATGTYDTGALLARVRATQLAQRLQARTREGKLDVALHIQSAQGTGADLAFGFRFFVAAGEAMETLQQQVLINGVKANIRKGLQLPIVESRASLAAPAALSLTERYRYRDGGSEGQGRRRIRFEPVDPDPGLFQGELLVEEASGRILEERSERSGLAGTVKSEKRTLSYAQAEDGAWVMAKAQTFERWLGSGGVAQVQRTLTFSETVSNVPGFEQRRQAARSSDAIMLKETLDGQRYFVKQADGSRRIEEKPRTSGRAIGGVLLVDPTLPLPVVPLAGLVYFDYDAFNRGVQINLITAVVFNMAQVVVPRIALGFDLSTRASLLLLPSTERPVRDGRLQDREGVSRRFGTLEVGLGHDLGGGLRVEGQGRFQYNRFSDPADDKVRTEGFQLPPSGWTREFRTELSWLHQGLQLAGYYGLGYRPEGSFGAPGALQPVPDQGEFRRWGGRGGYDQRLASGAWLHGELGFVGGKGFDRFKAISMGGTASDVRVAGIRSNAITADRLSYGKAGFVLPSGRNLRLTLTLDHARVRSMDDQKTYGFTGLGAAGDLPGFGWFTSVRLDLGVGLLSDLPGARSVNGFVALLRVF